MPLVDLKTNLKSLKYGRDRLNGGSSREPFISKDIEGLRLSDLHRTGGSDLLIRGGFLLGDRIADDVKRLGKYFTTTEGILWATTQNVLSETGVRIYGGYPAITNTFPGGGLGRLNDGTYLPSSTLLQLAANPFGGHLNKQGTDPTGLSIAGRPEYLKLQRDIKTANLVLGGDQEINRLLHLKKEHIDNPSITPNLYTYTGGPGAGTLTGGAGKTAIRFADQRTGRNNPLSNLKEFSIGKLFSTQSNLVQITQFGVSSEYGLNPETDNIFSLGDGLSLKKRNQVKPKFYKNKPLNPGYEIDRNSILNLPNEVPFNSDGTLNPNFDPTSIKDIPTIAKEYKENFDKEYKVKGGPEEVNLFNNFIPNPDRRFSSANYQDSYASKAEIEASLETSTEFNPDYKGVEGQNQIQAGDVILPNQDTNTGLDRTPTVIQDFRATKKTKTKAPDYNDKRIEKRVFLGDPGNPIIDRTDYTQGSTIGQDKINNMFIYRSDSVTDDGRKNDLVKFRIATIDPDEPNKKVFTHFRAFITGMSDSFGAEWDAFRYMGRGENFYNYQGFNRSMRLNWTVMAQSKNELATQYQKLNYLASTLAPNYSAAGFMRGNIHQLTIGGYVYEYPGIIESLDFTIPDDSTWEIGINTAGGFDNSVKELPHRIEVAMSFKPIDKFLPQTVKNISGTGEVKERFLSLENAESGDDNNLYQSVGNKKAVNVK